MLSLFCGTEGGRGVGGVGGDGLSIGNAFRPTFCARFCMTRCSKVCAVIVVAISASTKIACCNMLSF